MELTHSCFEPRFTVDEILEREPCAPEVEYQSRRAYFLARRPEKADEA